MLIFIQAIDTQQVSKRRDKKAALKNQIYSQSNDPGIILLESQLETVKCNLKDILKLEKHVEEDIIKICTFLLIFKNLINVAGKDFIDKTDGISAISSILKANVYPLLNHEISKDVTLLSIDIIVSVMVISKPFWMKNFSQFTEALNNIPELNVWTDNIQNKREITINSSLEDNQDTEIDSKYTISGSDSDTIDDKLIHLKEALRSISALFDWIIEHGLLNQTNKASKIQEGEFLLSKMWSTHEYIKRIILEGFLKYFHQSQCEDPLLLW